MTPTYIVVQVNADGDVNAWPAVDVEALPTMNGRSRIALAIDHSRIICENRGSDTESIADSAADAVRALCPGEDDDYGICSECGEELPGDPGNDVCPSCSENDDTDSPVVHDISDVILPVPYPRDQDTGKPPSGTHRIDHIPHDTTVHDVEGRAFRIIGYGHVQGAVMLRDPGGRAFQADGDTILAPIYTTGDAA